MIIANCECELCCKGSLPGVESHLLSEFIIKEATNRDVKANASGKGPKGQEMLFNIMPDKGVGLFFRGSGTEQAKDILKKEDFSDSEVEELKQMENPLTDKQLVCSSCEKLFEPIEDSLKKI